MFEDFKTLEECEQHKTELRSRLDAAADNDLDKIETELKALEARENELRAAKERNEKRSRLAADLAKGDVASARVIKVTEERADKPMTVEETLASKEYRSAFAKTLMGHSLNEIEKRAIGTVVTTTSATFTEASATVDGVNNGGVAIPTELNLSLLKALELQSPIFRDINKTSFAGVMKFPYPKTKNKATRLGKSKETTENTDGAVEFATLELKEAEISVTIPVTWKLEAMSVDQFMSYLLTELTNQVARSKIEGAIYGTGSEDMEGITINATAKSYTTETPLKAIETNIGALSAECKIGAKIYVSTTAAEAIQFAKDNDGAYIFPIASGMPKSLAGYSLEVDPYLKDGDIIMGNLTKYARINVIEAMTIIKDVVGKKRRNEYTAYEVDGSAAQPNTLLYIKKTTAS